LLLPRRVSPGEDQLSTLFEKEVLPTLQRQEGFQDEVTLVNRAGALGISLWNDRKSAETYESATYPQVLARLTGMIEGTWKVETYENGFHIRSRVGRRRARERSSV
jgi:hypothetical protein